MFEIVGDPARLWFDGSSHAKALLFSSTLFLMLVR
jgi:hypothetical protein